MKMCMASIVFILVIVGLVFGFKAQPEKSPVMLVQKAQSSPSVVESHKEPSKVLTKFEKTYIEMRLLGSTISALKLKRSSLRDKMNHLTAEQLNDPSVHSTVQEIFEIDRSILSLTFKMIETMKKGREV